MSLVFSAFSLKGPNSQVAQIPHCTGERKKSKNTVREKSNLIQLKATIIWMSHSAVRFGVFSMLIWERERDWPKKKRGKIIPFWNTAAPEDSLRSWERRKEKWGKKTERKQERQGRTDMGLDRYQSNFFSSSRIHPPGHGSQSLSCWQNLKT